MIFGDPETFHRLVNESKAAFAKAAELDPSDEYSSYYAFFLGPDGAELAGERALPPTNERAGSICSRSTEPELEALFEAWGHPKFRARQVWTWVYDLGRHLVRRDDEPASRPARGARATRIAGHLGALGGTDESRRDHQAAVPAALRAPRRERADAVPRRSPHGLHQHPGGVRHGLLLLCHGADGLRAAPVDAAEIVEQAWRYRSELAATGERLSNVVLMGMGEPFHNYDATVTGHTPADVGSRDRRAAHHRQHRGAGSHRSDASPRRVCRSGSR